MKIAVGADHAGFALKEAVKQRLIEEGHEVVDTGTTSEASTDYPDYAEKVAKMVAGGEAARGVLFCSTGVGMSIAANKIPGVRAALAMNEDAVELTRSHNDANVLTVGAKYTDPINASKYVDIFLRTPFEGGRHERRVNKIAAIEEKNA